MAPFFKKEEATFQLLNTFFLPFILLFFPSHFVLLVMSLMGNHTTISLWSSISYWTLYSFFRFLMMRLSKEGILPKIFFIFLDFDSSLKIYTIYLILFSASLFFLVYLLIITLLAFLWSSKQFFLSIQTCDSHASVMLTSPHSWRSRSSKSLTKYSKNSKIWKLVKKTIVK